MVSNVESCLEEEFLPAKELQKYARAAQTIFGHLDIPSKNTLYLAMWTRRHKLHGFTRSGKHMFLNVYSRRPLRDFRITTIHELTHCFGHPSHDVAFWNMHMNLLLHCSEAVHTCVEEPDGSSEHDAMVDAPSRKRRRVDTVPPDIIVIEKKRYPQQYVKNNYLFFLLPTPIQPKTKNKIKIKIKQGV